MSTAQTVNCKVRTINSKGYLNEMKRNQFIPGVIYGKGQESIPVFFQGKELTRIFEKHGSRGIFSLQVEGEAQPTMALIREVQKHPVNGNVIHVDFLSVNMNEQIHATVRIIVTGEDELIEKGGIPQLGAKQLEVLCLARNLPESFTVDASGLDIGQKIVAADIEMPEGIELVSEPESVIISILAPGRGTAIEETEEEKTEEPQE